MANKINSLQWFKAKYESGTLTDSNHLANALLTKPHLQDVVAYAFGPRFYLQYLTQGTGRVREEYSEVGNVEYTWPVMGDLLRAAVIAESGGANKGANFQYFTLPLRENYFFEGCVVKFESGVLARVMGPATQIGNDYQYTLQVVHSDPNVFVPESDLAEGKQVSIAFTAYEEGSDRSGTFNATPFYFKNQLTTIRLSREMTGSSTTDVMVLQLEGAGGKKSNYWLDIAEYQDMLVFQTMVERYRWYGEYNRTSTGEIFNKGKNGKSIIQGAGVLSQIAGSNKMAYNKLTTKVLNQFMGSLMSTSRYAENQKWLLFTGYGGTQAFQEAILGKYANIRVVDTTFTTKNGKTMTFNDQNFMTYKGINNAEITLVNMDLFNDRQFNTKMDPEGMYPMESHRMVFLDFSDYDGQPNISLVAKGGPKGSRKMVTWYEAGSTDPVFPGGQKWRMGSSSVDGWVKHWLSEQGIKVMLPTTCGELYRTSV